MRACLIQPRPQALRHEGNKHYDTVLEMDNRAIDLVSTIATWHLK